MLRKSHMCWPSLPYNGKKSCVAICMLDNFASPFLSGFLAKLRHFQKQSLRIPSECQTVWIQTSTTVIWDMHKSRWGHGHGVQAPLENHKWNFFIKKKSYWTRHPWKKYDGSDLDLSVDERVGSDDLSLVRPTLANYPVCV